MKQHVIALDLIRNAWLGVSNQLRRLRYRSPVHVILRVHGTYPERTRRQQRPFPLSLLLPWPAAPPSVDTFQQTLERLSKDDRVQGVVLVVSGLTADLQTIESLRGAIARFRESGKQVVAYLHGIGLASYFMAAACDRIMAPESASFRATGLRSETVFLKNTLALVGIEADFEAIAEYKVTPDTYRRSQMTEPHREMIESLLDSLYGTLAEAIAEGRGMSVEALKSLLDRSPMAARDAQACGLLDQVCYEDELAGHVGSPERPAALLTWAQAARRLQRPVRWRSQDRIGVISIEGTITSGPSRQAPLPLPLPMPAAQAGSETIVQQIRSAARNERVAAVVLHVDSPGGSAFASDLIWREVARLAAAKPVVAYMGSQATSGGYYVSAPAKVIFAQPTSITGSIGIWSGKIVTRGLFSKLQAEREVIHRGKTATLYADSEPFSDEERARVRAEIAEGYARFKRRVSEGRDLTENEVERVARGRVWTGKQALEHGLIDRLGDLYDAANHARELAGIGPQRHAPLVDIRTPGRSQLPLAWPTDVVDWALALGSLLQEGTLAMAPWRLWLRW